MATWDESLGHKCPFFRYKPALRLPKDLELKSWALVHASWTSRGRFFTTEPHLDGKIIPHKSHQTSLKTATWDESLGHKCACFRYEPVLRCPKDLALKSWAMRYAS